MTLDRDIVAENLDNYDINALDSDDEDDEEEVDNDPNSPQNKWKKIKADNANFYFPSLDKLMKMTGMHAIKDAALELFYNLIVQKRLQETQLKVDISTRLNFLFVGNPGTGKTTVGGLFAGILVESGLRKIVVNSANNSLMIQEAGTVSTITLLPGKYAIGELVADVS